MVHGWFSLMIRLEDFDDAKCRCRGFLFWQCWMIVVIAQVSNTNKMESGSSAKKMLILKRTFPLSGRWARGCCESVIGLDRGHPNYIYLGANVATTRLRNFLSLVIVLHILWMVPFSSGRRVVRILHILLSTSIASIAKDILLGSRLRDFACCIRRQLLLR